MFKNYFKTALNNFRRNSIFSAINLLGLAIGISASMVLFLIVYHEFSYDRFEKNGDQIFRVIMETRKDGVSNFGPAVPAPLSGNASSAITALTKTVPVFQFQGDATTTVTIKEKNNSNTAYKHQDKIIFTNQQYFDLPGYQWLEGLEHQALLNPYEVVLTESRAHQYFPSLPLSEIIGKNIVYGDSLTTTVSGIVKDISRNTFFTAKEFISYPTVTSSGLRDNFMLDVWDDWMSYSQFFVRLNNPASKEKTEAGLTALYARHSRPDNPAGKISFHLQPLSDLHFNYESIDHPTVNKSTIYGLLAIAAFLLFLGCINFVNLTTAQSSGRAREIGIRKTMGSSRAQLFAQFMTETFFVTLVATVLAICFLPLLLTVFEDFIPAELSFASLDKSVIVTSLCCLVVIVTMITGFYPAMVLSGMEPLSIIKGKDGDGSGHLWLRKSFTVSQFVIAQFFIIATVMISRQIDFIADKDLGFKKEAILSFNIPRQETGTRHFFLEQVRKVPGIKRASLGFVPPATEAPSYTDVRFKDAAPGISGDVQIRWGDTGYLSLYGIRLIAGRNIRQSDTVSEFLVNEAYTRLMGLKEPDQALGKFLVFNNQLVPVVGVMHDFHERSLHSGIEPLVFTSFDDQSNTMHIALNQQGDGTDGWKKSIGEIAALYSKTFPEAEFRYSFYDETIAKFYAAEERVAKLLRWATALTVMVSCLGLLGLVIYTTGKRTREIGIRKTLGASVIQIVALLSNDYLKLVIIACVISIPLSWWLVNDWLQDFAFRTDFNLSILIGSVFLLLGIALLTLVIQTSRAALANPVKASGQNNTGDTTHVQQLSQNSLAESGETQNLLTHQHTGACR